MSSSNIPSHGPMRVAVFGDSLFAWMIAWHLTRRSSQLRLLMVPSLNPQEPLLTGSAMQSAVDNITRVAVAHPEFYRQLYRIAEHGFNSLAFFLKSQAITHQLGDLCRYLSGGGEQEEAKKAVRILDDEGRAVHFLPEGSSSRIARQRENESVLVYARASLVDALRQDIDPSIVEQLGADDSKRILCGSSRLGCHEHQDGVVLAFPGKESRQLDAAIFVDHQWAKTALPTFQEVLVDVCEQCFDCDAGPFFEQNDLMATALHGHMWLLPLADQKLRLGGGRIFRKGIGVGESLARYDDQQETKVKEYLQHSLGLKIEAISNRQAAVECRPCDELPVVGPLSRSSRIFLNTGFSGWSEAFVWQAAAELAQLLFDGKTTLLPQEIWPNRFNVQL